MTAAIPSLTAGSIRTPATVRFDVPSAPRAMLVVIHGMAEHSARYRDVIEFFNAQGIGCCSFDQQGHGRSPLDERARGDVPAFDTFISDAVAVIDAARVRHPELPIFVWGHSMGAIIATLTAARFGIDTPTKVRGVITSSPPTAAFDFLPKPVLGVLKFASMVAPRTRLARPFKPERLSRDLQVGLRYGADVLVPKAVTLRFLVQLAQASAASVLIARKLRIPWLALHGDADEIAPAIGSQRLFDALASPDKQIRLWPGARHELHNEIEPTRTEMLQLMVEWMDLRSR
jgi:alpha-beta hydrolase superfamily lysophospholipase